MPRRLLQEGCARFRVISWIIENSGFYKVNPYGAFDFIGLLFCNCDMLLINADKNLIFTLFQIYFSSQKSI